MRKGIIIYFGVFLLAQVAFSQNRLGGLLADAEELVQDWRYEEAEKVVREIESLAYQEKNSIVKFQAESFLAKHYFYLGDYKNGYNWAKEARELGIKGDKDFEEFYSRLGYLAELFSSAKQETSIHFRIKWVNPKDEVLVEPGLEVLEKAYQALTRDFNFYPEGEKILVEIYPGVSELGVAVGLGEQMLRDSGTIAVCKYRRIMMVSPRALAFGYDYLTTLSHELVHFFIYARNGDTVALWLHEGLAKSMESSYLGKTGELGLISQSFLVSAIKNNELITFEQMSPTFAKFKSPKQGQLAFAEVCTMVEYIKEKCGRHSWIEILDLSRQKKNDKQILEGVCGESFSELWEGWKSWVLSKNWQEIPGAMVLKMEFKEQSGEVKEDEEIETGRAGEYARLGDLLRDRGEYQASAVEYKKALSYDPYHPKLLNKLGLALLLSGDYKSSIETFIKLTKFYPTYSTGFVNLGLAYLSAGEEEKAIWAFEKTLELNPFNPTPYRKLIEIYLKNGKTRPAEKMKEKLEIIKG